MLYCELSDREEKALKVVKRYCDCVFDIGEMSDEVDIVAERHGMVVYFVIVFDEDGEVSRVFTEHKKSI